MCDRGPHDLVVGGVEFDAIDPLSETIVTAQSRPVAMRIPAQTIEVAAGDASIPSEMRRERATPLACHRFAQRRIGTPQIAGAEFRRLVADRVGLV
jgi:hypothetical protein